MQLFLLDLLLIQVECFDVLPLSLLVHYYLVELSYSALSLVEAWDKVEILCLGPAIKGRVRMEAPIT